MTESDADLPALPALLDAARAWRDDDPDAATRDELDRLITAAGPQESGPSADAARAELADRFAGPLRFGTAGLRGALGAGPARMNRVVVQRAAAGLAAHLRAEGASGAVVIGYDARHRSLDFARDTAAVVAGAGLTPLLLPRALPTPVLAFAVRDLRAAAGVMVTASHNPPQDNGYKVYLGDGRQIVAPDDAAIAAHIDAVGAVADLPRGEVPAPLDDAVVERYLDRVVSLVAPDGSRELTVVHTALHGVGTAPVRAVLERAGFAAPVCVPEQAEPDPDFPTVAFPNPEEPGALDLAIALARDTGADVVLANDPDADRCAAAVPTGHGWRVLRGDEVGALLADHLLRSGRLPDDGVLATTIVSSTLLRRLAAAHGHPFAQTLTGFKWISRAEGLAFGYEEALGYCCDPSAVGDKDGVSALLLLAELAASLRAEGHTLVDRLDELARAHGLHATDQVSVRVDDLALIADAMQRLRSTPPAALGGLAVEALDDLADGVDGLPATDGLRFSLAGGARVVVRPSGTEPKLKGYLEVVVPVDASQEPPDDVDAARITAAGRLDALAADLRLALGL